MAFEIKHGDCLEVMRGMADNSVDAIVTDPPYGLSFMGKDWDHGVPGSHFWAEALRVAKPGAHLLAFGGTRTFHRLAVAIEDAGWEMRDTLMWVYGGGFPKSLDVSKAIDKAAGAEREVVHGTSSAPNGKAGGYEGEVQDQPDKTAPATEAAKQWDGWGTALKPAWEPIIMARKPLEGTVVQNVLEHGTGALNIDGCRIDGAPPSVPQPDLKAARKSITGFDSARRNGEMSHASGRWPANLIHDGSEEVLAGFPQTASGSLNSGHKRGSGRTSYDGGGGVIQRDYGGDTGSAARFFYCAKASKADRDEGLHVCEEKEVKINMVQNRPCANCGGWSPNLAKYRPQSCCQCGDYDPIEHRKTTSKNHHPTVKPTALMRYLVRLVTPPGGTVLDPFTGSGSTGKAAILEGFEFIGIEREAEYVAIAQARISEVQRQLGLFA